jgi:hypothetical protein
MAKAYPGRGVPPVRLRATFIPPIGFIVLWITAGLTRCRYQPTPHLGPRRSRPNEGEPITTTKQVTSHEVIRTLSASELDAVSGGWLNEVFEAIAAAEQVLAAKTFAQALQGAAQV